MENILDDIKKSELTLIYYPKNNVTYLNSNIKTNRLIRNLNIENILR
jgi:hypothetical protein